MFIRGQLILTDLALEFNKCSVLTDKQGRRGFYREDQEIVLEPGTAVMFYKKWVREFSHGFATKLVVLHDGSFYVSKYWYYNNEEITRDWHDV